MSTSRPPVPGSSRGVPAAAQITPKQRLRVRKLVHRGLIGVVVIQAFLVVSIMTPAANAFVVFDPTAAFNWATSFIEQQLQSRLQGLMDQKLQVVQDLAQQHSVQLNGNANNFRANDVSTRVVEDAFNRHRITGGGEIPVGNQRVHHLGYTSQASVQAMQDLMPGVKAWENYQEDYLASADGALTTMRASMDALNQFHQHMVQDDQRFDALLRKANGLNSQLAVGQIQVESNLEVARQLQALRAQQALQTNIYAVTESHRVSSDARSMAKAKRNNCQMLAMFGGGLMGGLAGDVAGTLASQACN